MELPWKGFQMLSAQGTLVPQAPSRRQSLCQTWETLRVSAVLAAWEPPEVMGFSHLLGDGMYPSQPNTLGAQESI